MKYVAVVTLSLALLACQGNTQQKVELKSQEDSLSYAIGMDIGKNLKTQSAKVDPAIMARGVKDILDSAKTMLSEDQAQGCLMSFSQRMMEKREAEMKVKGDQGKVEGENFLAANKTKEGVVTTASGLQYKIITKGTGPKPTATQTVRVHYRGTFIDGKEFDSSYKRGQPIEFPVNGVIKGWTEALQLMPVGSKWQLFIPSDIAYGDRGAGQAIPPNSTLIFDVELLGIK
jgi:FKBP-type peptidyl-prolyl cis-trans isomerase FklB